MEWISVKDRLPANDRTHNWFFVYMEGTSFPRMQSAVFNMNNEWKYDGANITDLVTHWRPLFEPPKL